MRKQVLGAYYSAFSVILTFSLHVFDWGCARARGSYQSKVCTCRHRNKVIKGPQETHGTGNPRPDVTATAHFIRGPIRRACKSFPEKNQMSATYVLEARAHVGVNSNEPAPISPNWSSERQSVDDNIRGVENVRVLWRS
jgi:hypothetical protein